MRCRELWLRVTEREQREGYRPMHRSSKRQVRPSAMMRQAARPQPRENSTHVVELTAGKRRSRAEFFPKKFNPAGLALPFPGY